MAGEDWLGVEFRHLAALEAIAREGSFSRAATTLGYTQSAVSSQLATLERLVGARLVERPPGLRQVGLTESGEALLSHARAVHAALEVARAELASRREEACVKIGFFDGIAEAFLPAIVRAAAAEVPEVVFCPREARTTSDLLDRVAEGKLDLALVALPVRRAGIRTQLVLRDPYDLLLPPEHELASDPGPVSLCALRGLRLVLYGTDDQDRVRGPCSARRHSRRRRSSSSTLPRSEHLFAPASRPGSYRASSRRLATTFRAGRSTRHSRPASSPWRTRRSASLRPVRSFSSRPCERWRPSARSPRLGSPLSAPADRSSRPTHRRTRSVHGSCAKDLRKRDGCP